MNYRMIAYSVGRILVAVAATMLAPLGLSLFYGESIALAYVIPIVISVLIGLCVSAKAPKNKSLYGRDGMFIVAIGWIVISIISCLPFYISGQIPSFVDSFFSYFFPFFDIFSLFYCHNMIYCRLLKYERTFYYVCIF